MEGNSINKVYRCSDSDLEKEVKSIEFADKEKKKLSYLIGSLEILRLATHLVTWILRSYLWSKSLI